MNHTLLLQKDVFSEDEFSDTEAIIRKYFPQVKIIQDEEIYQGKLPTPHPGPMRGSLALASRLHRRYPFADATQWAPTFSKEILSKDYIFLDAKSILERNPLQWPAFIRPTSGNKAFSGNVFTQESFQREYHFLTVNKNCEPETLCLVSSPTTLKREWRTIIIQGQYVSGSLYMESGEKILHPDVPTEVIQLAQRLAHNPFFQNIFEFTLDIGETPNGLALVEVNGFETASFYASDLEKIYQKWSQTFQ